jgi:hypothetical protein
MTVTVPATQAAIRSHNATTLAAIFGVLLLPLTLRRTRKQLQRNTLLALLLFASLAGVAALTGCASNVGILQEPVTNYTLTITAASGTVSHTTTVTLNVQ